MTGRSRARRRCERAALREPKSKDDERDWAVNRNMILVDGFSCRATEKLYQRGFPDEPELRRQYEGGFQCESCSGYAKFNADWGLCCSAKSRHHLETVFEHFTCPSYVMRRTDECEL